MSISPGVKTYLVIAFAGAAERLVIELALSPAIPKPQPPAPLPLTALPSLKRCRRSAT
jgi:hypothetical protein